MDAGRQHAVDTGKGVGQLLRDGVGHASLFLRGGRNHPLPGKNFAEVFVVRPREVVLFQYFKGLNELILIHGQGEPTFPAAVFSARMPRLSSVDSIVLTCASVSPRYTST